MPNPTTVFRTRLMAPMPRLRQRKGSGPTSPPVVYYPAEVGAWRLHWRILDKRRRRAIGLLWVQAMLLSATGCRSEAPVRPPGDRTASLASTVYTGDPNSEIQLLSGFYRIEEYSWRWTAQRFSVVLRPPEGATGEGANLVVRLGIPEVVIQKLRSISLSAAIGGSALTPETYTKPGDYTYTRAVAAKLLVSEEVRIDFQLDKFLSPAGQDERRLGVVVTSIGLEPQ